MNDKTSAAKSAEVVHGLCREVERISGELQKARAELDARDAEIERYREALLPFAELAATIEKHNAVPAALAPWWGDLINAAATLEANHDTD